MEGRGCSASHPAARRRAARPC